jgi:PBP1b-binding outer membrane lipoprotein LpoB
VQGKERKVMNILKTLFALAIGSVFLAGCGTDEKEPTARTGPAPAVEIPAPPSEDVATPADEPAPSMGDTLPTSEQPPPSEPAPPPGD